jgi:hypothetical protein
MIEEAWQQHRENANISEIAAVTAYNRMGL